jgi:hypothetical protein
LLAPPCSLAQPSEPLRHRAAASLTPLKMRCRMHSELCARRRVRAGRMLSVTQFSPPALLLLPRRAGPNNINIVLNAVPGCVPCCDGEPISPGAISQVRAAPV